MKMKMLPGLLLAVLFLGGCDLGVGNGESDMDPGTGEPDTGEPDPDPAPSGIRVSIRVVAETAEDLDGLEIIAAELEAEGVTATLLLAPDFVRANCEQVGALQEAGFEIMAYAPALEIDGQSFTLSELSEQEQPDYLQDVKEAFDECAIPIEGFGCAEFDQNDDTWNILAGQGYTYNLGFLAYTLKNLPGHEGAFWPYESEEYGFWAVPMHSVYINRQRIPLSDAYFIEQLDAAGWKDLLKSQLDLMDGLGLPLTVEVHARLTGTDEQWLDALMNLIANARRKDVVFASVEELIAWVRLRVDEIICLPCLQ